jgi:hypothetical protein
MPQTVEAPSCTKEFFDWAGALDHVPPDGSWSGARGAQTNDSVCLDWGFAAHDKYESSNRVKRVYKWHSEAAHPCKAVSKKSKLVERFSRLAIQWRQETRFLSSTEKKILHPAYQSIIAMGAPAVKFVLQDLKSSSGHWFWALQFMTGENPVPQDANMTQARESWLAWGRGKGLIL